MAEKKKPKRTQWQRDFIRGFTGKDIGLEKKDSKRIKRVQKFTGQSRRRRNIKHEFASDFD